MGVNTRAYIFVSFLCYAFTVSKELANTLREAIRKSGKSAYALAGATGVPQPTITRFLAGADMKLETASKIAAYLGMELRKKK